MLAPDFSAPRKFFYFHGEGESDKSKPSMLRDRRQNKSKFQCLPFHHTAYKMLPVLAPLTQILLFLSVRKNPYKHAILYRLRQKSPRKSSKKESKGEKSELVNKKLGFTDAAPKQCYFTLKWGISLFMMASQHTLQVTQLPS